MCADQPAPGLACGNQPAPRAVGKLGRERLNPWASKSSDVESECVSLSNAKSFSFKGG